MSTVRCRRVALAAAFGDSMPACSHAPCDVCSGQLPVQEVGVAAGAEIALECVRRLEQVGQLKTARQLADIVRGAGRKGLPLEGVPKLTSRRV